MSTESSHDADVEWKKVQDARVPWVELKNRNGNEWPHWVQKLDVQLRAWIYGERVVYAEFGAESDGQLSLRDAHDVDWLWAVILTNQALLRVSVPKKPRSIEAETAEVKVIPRSEIKTLDLLVPEVPDGFGPPMVITATFGDERVVLQIPADPERWYQVGEQTRLEAFAGLRDNLFRYSV